MMDYRGQRRAYRRYRHYGPLNGIIWPLAIMLFFVTHFWFWFLLAIFVPILLVNLLRSFETNPQQQQAYTQPTYQYQSREQPMYQQPYQQAAQPVYQPYSQGYTPQQPSQPAPIIQEREQPYQYQEQQQMQQQYEDPLTMYPQE